jgi:hypothetical protein
MADDNQQQVAYNKAVQDQQMAYRLFNNARYNQQNPYLSQQTPAVQRYYNYYQNKDELKIAKENEAFQQQVQKEQQRLGTTTGPLTKQQVSSFKETEKQFFQSKGPTKTITSMQQQIMQGPSQASSFDFTQFNKQSNVLKSGGSGSFTAAVNVGNNQMQDYVFVYKGSQVTSAKGLGSPMDIFSMQPRINLNTGNKPSLQQFIQPARNSLISAFNEGPRQTKNITPIGQNVGGGSTSQITTSKDIGTGFNFGNITPSVNQKPSLQEFMQPKSNVLLDRFNKQSESSIGPSYSQENFRLGIGEGLQGVGKNIFNVQVIGQAQDPLTGIENYFKQAFFDPFKYSTKTPFQEKISSSKTTIDIAKELGYSTKQEFSFPKAFVGILFNSPSGLYSPTKEVVIGSPTRQELFESGKSKLFTSSSIGYSGQLLGSYQSILGKSISSRETSLSQEALNQKTKSLGVSYQDKINKGELSFDLAQSKYQSEVNVLEKEYTEALNFNIDQSYSKQLTGSNSLFQNLKKYEQEIYTPKSDKAFNIALPISRVVGQTALLSTGISGVTLGASALGQAYTYKDYASYIGNYKDYSTTQKIIGGVGLGLEQAGVIIGLKTGYKQFNVEDLNLRIEGLSQAKGQLQGISLQKLEGNQALLTTDTFRETGSGFANTRSFNKLTFNEYSPGKTNLEIFSGQVTKGQVYNPGTYSYQSILESSTSTSFVPNIFSDKTLKSVGSYPGISNEIVDLSIGKSTYISRDLANIKDFKFYGITQPREGYTDIIAGYGKGTKLKLSFGESSFSVSDYSVSGNIKNIVMPSEQGFSNAKSFDFGKFSGTPSGQSSSFQILSPRENQIFSAASRVTERAARRESSQIFKQLSINQLTSGISASVGQSYGAASIGISSQSQLVSKGLSLSLPTQSFISSPQRNSFSTQSLLPQTKQLMSPLSILNQRTVVIPTPDSGSGTSSRNRGLTGLGSNFFQDTSNTNKLIQVPVSNINQRLRQDQKLGFNNLTQQSFGFSSIGGFGGGIGGFPIGFGSPKSFGGIGGFGMKNKGFSYRNIKPSFTAVALNLKGSFPKSMSIGNMNFGISPGELRLLPGGRSGRKGKKSKASKKSSPRKSTSKRSSKKRR